VAAIPVQYWKTNFLTLDNNTGSKDKQRQLLNEKQFKKHLKRYLQIQFKNLLTHCSTSYVECQQHHFPHDKKNCEAVGQALFIPLNTRTPLLLV